MLLFLWFQKMERQLQTHYTATLSHSFSMPSLAEGSEPISEVEEINEVKKKDNTFYNETLSISSLHVTNVNARKRQVFGLCKLNYQRFPNLGLYLKFSLYRIPVYSGFDWHGFHCIHNLNNLGKILTHWILLNQNNRRKNECFRHHLKK